MECTIECIHIGFTEEKRAYLLYSWEKRRLFESRDVEFEEIEGQEQVTVDLDSDNDSFIDPPSTENGDPEGGRTDGNVDNDIDNVPSPSVKEVDHQDLSPSTPAHPNISQPLRCSACSNKGIPPVHPDEDPKLSLGSRSSAKGTTSPAVQDPANASVGAGEIRNEVGDPLLNIVDDDVGALFLTVDAPQSYREAMRHNDTDGWVEAIAEEYENLHHKGVFVEVDVPLDVCIHEGRLVFTEKVRSEGAITKRKARLVAKGYTEVWGEDYWHMYSLTLGCDTLFSCLAYAASKDLEIHQLDAVAAYLNSDLTEEIYLSPPDGVPSTPGKVWRLKKALYSLKQAGLEWYSTLRTHIQSLGYAQSGHDPCLYTFDSERFVVV